MGQKVNPHGFRVGVIKDWDSRWYANKAAFGDMLVEDYNVRNFIKKRLYAAGVARVEIERFADKTRIHIHCAKPGIVIGKGGAEIEKLRSQVEAMMSSQSQVLINIVEVKQPDLNAQLVAEKIALDLENRISFRRAMKQSIGRAIRLGAKGIKTRVSGRLGGAEVVEPLVEALNDENPQVCITATDALIEIGDVAADALIENVQKEYTKIIGYEGGFFACSSGDGVKEIFA